MCLAQGPHHFDAGEARTRGPSVSSLALYHWATALPPMYKCSKKAYCTDTGKYGPRCTDVTRKLIAPILVNICPNVTRKLIAQIWWILHAIYKCNKKGYCTDTGKYGPQCTDVTRKLNSYCTDTSKYGSQCNKKFYCTDTGKYGSQCNKKFYCTDTGKYGPKCNKKAYCTDIGAYCQLQWGSTSKTNLYPSCPVGEYNLLIVTKMQLDLYFMIYPCIEW